MASTSGSKRKPPNIIPVTVLKKKKEESEYVNVDACLFCQKPSDLRCSSEDGRSRVVQSAIERRELNDVTSSSIIGRVLRTIGNNQNCSDVKWHHVCYSSFTHQGKLTRLRKKHEAAGLGIKQPSTRSNREKAIDWKVCMFCQEGDCKNIRNVATMELSQKIIDLSKLDSTMHIRLANISDLVAAEGKYHLKCWVKFQRKASKVNKTIDGQGNRDDCLARLCADIIKGLGLGHVYDTRRVWLYYTKMCEKENVELPQMYTTRRSSFYNDVKQLLGEKAGFVRLDQKSHLLIYPSDKSNFVIAEHLTTEQITIDNELAADDNSDEVAPLQNNMLLDLIHTALHIRNDLGKMPGHNAGWTGIDQEHVTRVIPESLYLFIQVLLGGTDALEQSSGRMHTQTCNIAQDIVYSVSKGSKLTPKHIGLGLTLHQATRSEKLVDLFHAAGHTIGMDTIRRIDTSIATDILTRYEENRYVYVPYELVPYSPGHIILASCDNIDVLEETIDGKNTFHCTQMMLWQRGPARKRPDMEVNVSRAKTIPHSCLEQFHKLDYAYLPAGERPNPVFHPDLKIDTRWFAETGDQTEAQLKNLTWILARMHNDGQQIIPAWAAFNEAISTSNPPITTPGMLPILQAPADDNNTMTTVINHFMAITENLGQPCTVIAVDQPLYSRGKELLWANPEKYSSVVLVMGHLHVPFNFLKAIGQHMENAGLVDIWVESGIFAQNSTEQMMEGKAYYRAVRGHTLAYEALSRIYWHHFIKWIKGQDQRREPDLTLELEQLVQEFSQGELEGRVEKVSNLTETLKKNNILVSMEEYDFTLKNTPNFMLWRTYMRMVETLLNFIRANRDGNWPLHLDSFAEMLPWMTVYDHTNYARWGTIYLSEMKGIEISQPAVYREFVNGNFVVRRSNARFNQIPIDQATEWQNRVCKISNGIIGITRNDTARDKFCITWAERSFVSHSTRVLLGSEKENNQDTISTRKDAQPSRIKSDEDAVRKIEEQFTRFNVFRIESADHDNQANIVSSSADAATEATEQMQVSTTVGSDDDSQLISLATNDVSTAAIQQDMLSAKKRGMELVCENVTQWLVSKDVPFFNPLKKTKSRTFASLYKTTITNKQNDTKQTIKADRRLLQRLLTASLAGRQINMQEILQHELSGIPLSLAKMNGDMNSTSKSEMFNILTSNDEILHSISATNLQQKACALIDGHALIQSLGKPQNCRTFEEYAHIFFKSVIGNVGENVQRIDVVFDTYITQSIKSTTRSRRSTKKRPIRKIINRGDLALPQVWANFISLADNKADLARYLSEYLVSHGNEFSGQCELVTGGGFQDPTKAYSTQRDVLPMLCNHEEADTRLIFHAFEAVANNFNKLLLLCRDTDVFLLSIHFLGQHQDIETWMLCGTTRQRKCYPIHTIAQQLPQIVISNILGFHALTGCDTTSSFASFGKRTCWKVFEQHSQLLYGIGRDGEIKDAEEFVCRLYGAPDPLAGVNKCRHDLFEKGNKDLEKLPPTSDSLKLHVARCNHQAKVWLQANIGVQQVNSPSESGGWKTSEENLEVVWTTLPSIPKFCVNLISCGCTKKCKTAACKCSKNHQRCTPFCGCNANDCRNPHGLTQE